VRAWKFNWKVCAWTKDSRGDELSNAIESKKAAGSMDHDTEREKKKKQKSNSQLRRDKQMGAHTCGAC
jgi:hypothetical protein